MLWKFTRMNLLPGHAAIQHLSTGGIDPYEGLDASAIEHSTLAYRR